MYKTEERRGALETRYLIVPGRMTEYADESSGEAEFVVIGWETFEDDNVIDVRVVVLPEPEGGFSAHAARLPGVVSEGETVSEALHNFKDALCAVLEEYKKNGPIPWQTDTMDRPKGSVECRVVVNV